jgi:dihydroneopterin aldolase|tara:strand:+ start:335 stop:478 length:144 start_codon:yes stop_codon:yes gene_type:complete
MDLQEVLDKLEESMEEKNWDLVQEVFEELIEINLDNPYDDYDGEDWG